MNVAGNAGALAIQRVLPLEVVNPLQFAAAPKNDPCGQSGHDEGAGRPDPSSVAGGIDHAGVVVGEAIGSVVGIELCTRTDGLDPEQKACAMALLDRIAWLFRGLGSG